MGGIFISYRREDSAGHAGRLFDHLKDKFGKDRVFMDVSRIEPGVDFVEAIDREVGSCELLLVIIGRKWLTCLDQNGQRRIDDPKDFIRLETATALKRNIRVIPVLVQDAAMPTEADLPDILNSLARRQAIEISDSHWESDSLQLIETISKIISDERGAPPTITQSASSAAEAVKSKSRLAWIVSAITAATIGLGSLLTAVESARDTVGRFFSLFGGKPAQQTVITGPASAETVKVPNLIGLRHEEAVTILANSRLAPGELQPKNDSRPPGTIIEQHPDAGSSLAPGSRVNLAVAAKTVDSPPQQTDAKPPQPKAKVKMVTVPHLAGQSEKEARGSLAKAGLEAGEVEQTRTDKAKPGTIIKQSPQAGAKLAVNSQVRLTVAAADTEADLINVPNVTGLTAEKAVALLKRAGLVQSRKTEQVLANAQPGTVIRQQPSAGSRVPPREGFALVVAAGKLPPGPDGKTPSGEVRIRVPEFTGQDFRAVRELLNKSRLTLGKVQKQDSEQPQGTVLSQRPPAGATVEPESPVDFVLAAKSAVSRLSPPKQLAPANGESFNIFPRETLLRWAPIPGASRYSVEIDCMGCCEGGRWCSDTGRPWKIVPNLATTSYKFQFVGAQPGRWRVWAIDEKGRAGAKSDWWSFTHRK